MTNPAVSTAWKEPYKSSGDILENVLKKYIVQDTASPHYARYASITQSSGTGKSRMVDELAKKIFCIPMSLGSDQGWHASCLSCTTLADTIPTSLPPARCSYFELVRVTQATR